MLTGSHSDFPTDKVLLSSSFSLTQIYETVCSCISTSHALQCFLVFESKVVLSLQTSSLKLLGQVSTLGGTNAPTLSVGRWLFQLLTFSFQESGESKPELSPEAVFLLLSGVTLISVLHNRGQGRRRALSFRSVLFIWITTAAQAKCAVTEVF